MSLHISSARSLNGKYEARVYEVVDPYSATSPYYFCCEHCGNCSQYNWDVEDVASQAHHHVTAHEEDEAL